MVVDRVSYEPQVLKQLGAWATVQNSAFSLEDRMGLVNDAITLAKAGTSPTTGALDLIAGLKNETESSLALLPMLDTTDVTMYRSCLGEYRLDYRVG